MERVEEIKIEFRFASIEDLDALVSIKIDCELEYE